MAGFLRRSSKKLDMKNHDRSAMSKPSLTLCHVTLLLRQGHLLCPPPARSRLQKVPGVRGRGKSEDRAGKSHNGGEGSCAAAGVLTRCAYLDTLAGGAGQGAS